MQHAVTFRRAIHLAFIASITAVAHNAQAVPPDGRLCIEEAAPPGSPLSGGYAELTVSDQGFGRAQLYGTACFKNPLLGDAQQCFAVYGAMISEPPTDTIHISLSAAALATVPLADSFFGFAQQYLEMNATTLTGTHRTLGTVVQGETPTEHYIQGAAEGIRCPNHPVADQRRERTLNRFIRNLDRK